jgi:hypothetical protein
MVATVQPGGEEWVKTCEKVGGDDQELVRKLLKVGRSAGRREHGEETSVMPMVKVLVGRYLKQICMMNKI